MAGVASYINEHYRVRGIHVRVTEMDLPIKSGLSSSAAICVLVARAFNKLYHLHLNTMGEMNIAYMGEQRTLPVRPAGPGLRVWREPHPHDL